MFAWISALTQHLDTPTSVISQWQQSFDRALEADICLLVMVTDTRRLSAGGCCCLSVSLFIIGWVAAANWPIYKLLSSYTTGSQQLGVKTPGRKFHHPHTFSEHLILAANFHSDSECLTYDVTLHVDMNLTER